MTKAVTVDLMVRPSGVCPGGLCRPARDPHRRPFGDIPGIIPWRTPTRSSMSRPSLTGKIRSTAPPWSAARPWRTATWPTPPSGSSCRCCAPSCPRSATIPPWKGCSTTSCGRHRQGVPGHAAKVMSAMWGSGQMSFAKAVLLVDDRACSKKATDSCGISWIPSTRYGHHHHEGILDVLDIPRHRTLRREDRIDATARYAEKPAGRKRKILGNLF